MFREMRRSALYLDKEECESILRNGSSGVLSVAGDDGYPYGVPISYVYEDGKIYFHCATTGHKLDAIAKNDKVSFCVIGQDQIVQELYTTFFLSVIAFGRARVLTDDAERRKALTTLALKYSPDFPDGIKPEIDLKLKGVTCVEITIEHMTGKGANKLLQARKAAQQG